MVKALDLRSEWFLKDYKLGLKNYPFPKVCAVLSLLKEYDLRSKGVDTEINTVGEEALMKELFFRILH
jgi:DNA polymerase-3 subunit delta